MLWAQPCPTNANSGCSEVSQREAIHQGRLSCADLALKKASLQQHHSQLPLISSAPWSRQESRLLLRPPQEPSSSPCTTRSYQGEHPAQSPASGLGTSADPGTPRGYKTGRAWTTPLSDRLLSSLWRKRSWSVPVLIPSICLFLLANAFQPYNTWVYLKYSPTEPVQMRPFAISPDCVAGCQEGKKKHCKTWT